MQDKTVLEVCCEVAKSYGYSLKEIYKNGSYRVLYFQNTKYKWKSLGSYELDAPNKTPNEIYIQEFENQSEETIDQKNKSIIEYKLKKI